MMSDPRCIAQYLRNESPRQMDFTITHGRGRKGIIIRTRKPSIWGAVKQIIKANGVSKWLS